MSEQFDDLIEVQGHDTALDQLHRRKVTLEAKATLAGIEAARADLVAEATDLHDRVDELARRQQAIEEQIAASAKRRHDLEQRMLSGSVSDARDLQAMDTEVHHLADRQAQLEEQELELVEEQDPLDGELAANESAAAAFDEQSVRLREEIAEAERAIDVEIAAQEAVRREVAARLPAELAERYESLRARLGGVGAARLVGDHCDGCHLTLPSVEVERIRNLPADEFATCEQCGRILVH